jgi:hypothetical protein
LPLLASRHGDKMSTFSNMTCTLQLGTTKKGSMSLGWAFIALERVSDPRRADRLRDDLSRRMRIRPNTTSLLGALFFIATPLS